MTYKLQIDELPSRRKILLSFYGLSILYAIPYGALSTLVPGFFIYGDRHGASEESEHQAESIVAMQGSLIFFLWVAFQFFVPSLIDALRGPKNGFVTMMFGWGVAAAMLIGAYISSLSGPSSSVKGFAIAFAILVGTFGPLGWTASEVYLDYCAEWMAHVDLAAKNENDDDNLINSLLQGSDSQRLSSTHTQHKALASTYKNRFASHLYAIIEVGSLIFYLPMIIIGESAAQNLIIAVTVCLFVGAGISLALYNFQEPPEIMEVEENSERDYEASNIDQSEADDSGAKKCPCVRDTFVLAWKSLISCFKCLSAYRGMAALAIIPYFFGGAFADIYRYNILLGPQCGLDEENGVGLSRVELISLISTITQAISAFVSPLLIGERSFQFREHGHIMAIGNGCGCLSVVLVMVSGGNDAMCSSFGLLTGANVLMAISFAVNNSVGVAAILSWYEGKYQNWVVAALASRSVWTNLGQAIAPTVYSQDFGELSNGIPCAAVTLALYAIGSICVIMAHWINTRRSKMDTGDEKMTAGFEANIRLMGTYHIEEL